MVSSAFAVAQAVIQARTGVAVPKELFDLMKDGLGHFGKWSEFEALKEHVLAQMELDSIDTLVELDGLFAAAEFHHTTTKNIIGRLVTSKVQSLQTVAARGMMDRMQASAAQGSTAVAEPSHDRGAEQGAEAAGSSGGAAGTHHEQSTGTSIAGLITGAAGAVEEQEQDPSTKVVLDQHDNVLGPLKLLGSTLEAFSAGQTLKDAKKAVRSAQEALDAFMRGRNGDGAGDGGAGVPPG
jgi:hypothetical protein